ncbi:hypothetical protein C8R47DRAFT_1152124 [Mycena vitilis]|nr:hypothetical protein C8R47DRAFT_1152124 [Mycena vitilis]
MARQRDQERDKQQQQQQQQQQRPWFPAPARGGGGPFDGHLPPLERGFPPLGGPASGYMRSPSAGSGSAPSRGGAGSPAGGVSASQGGGYTLPPVRGAYYGHEGPGGSGSGSGSGSGGSGNGSGLGLGGIALGLGAPMTVEDLERHYFNLHEQRRKTEELLRDTETIMLNVKRGLEDMKQHLLGGRANAGAGESSISGGPDMVPLRERGRPRSREGQNIWPVNGDPTGRE